MACGAGFISIIDAFLNPDGSQWTGSITYTLRYATTAAGATVVNAEQQFNVANGIDICLAPGLYTVVLQQSGFAFAIASEWGIPISGGPYTVAEISSNVTLQGSFGSVLLLGSPVTGQVPTAVSSTEATWQTPGGGGGGVTAVTGTLPIVSSGGTTPAISASAATNSSLGVAQADGVSITAAAGVFSALVKTLTTTIHQAAIFTLNTIPVTLIPAPPAGSVLFPVAIVFQVKGNATYGCDSGLCNLIFKIGATTTLLTWNIINDLGGFTTFLAELNLMNDSQYVGESSTFSGQPLTVQMTDPITGTGGDFTFTLFYIVLALP